MLKLRGTYPISTVALPIVPKKHGTAHSIAMNNNIETIVELREHYVSFGGFSGGWNVLLENFKEAQAFGTKIAVSEPIQAGSWITKQFGGLAHSVEIGGGLVVVVIEDWDALVRRVHQDALKERLLVMITGNLFGDDWNKAVQFSGRKDGLVRRSQVGVPVGAAYWYPTKEQLSTVLSIPA